MREVFQRHLRSLGEEAHEVRGCQISFMRQRAGLRCLVHYTLHLKEPSTGREWRQLVTGVMYGRDRTRRTWERLRRSDQAWPVPDASPAFAPFSYIPDLDMLVQVFPYDHRLPALPLLMAGPPPELEPLLLARFGTGSWHTEVWDAEPVRYRVDMRATLRLRVLARDAATDRAEEKCFYAKIYREEVVAEQTYQTLRELWDKAGASRAGFAVARPVAYLSGFCTLLQEEVPGTSFRNAFIQMKREAKTEEEVLSEVRRVARALAALHLSDAFTPRRRYLRDEVARLQGAANLLQSAYPHLRPEVEEVVGAVVDGLEEVPPVPIHGDFKPNAILVAGDRLTLLDLDTFAGGDPLLDVANFLTNLGEVYPRFSLPHERTRAVARAFTEEYFAHVPESWRAGLSLHYAMAILKKFASLHQNREHGWLASGAEVEAFLQEAKDSLAGRVL